MPATTRSMVYLTTNCQPFGSIGRISSSGRPPMCSTVTRSTETSNRRGTSEADTPSSRQRRTMPSITLCGAVEKVKITCSTPCSSRMPSRSQLAPSTGSEVAAALDARAGRCPGSPTGCRPNSGRCIRRRATRWPTLPAPTIRVARPSPRVIARLRVMNRPVRPTERNTAARTQVCAVWADVCGSSTTMTRTRSPPSWRRRWRTRSGGPRRAGASAGAGCTCRGRRAREHQRAEDDDPSEGRLGVPAR